MNIERLDKKNIQGLIKVAETYRDVFATEPWNEVSRGPNCGKFYENQPGTVCPCGCGKLQEAYPTMTTVGYIRKEISKPNAIALTTEKDGIIVGFAWGYEETSEEFATSKYKPENRNFISQLIGPNKRFFYMSECGLVKPERSMGLGTEMSLKLVSEASQFNQSVLLRTNKGSLARFIAKKLNLTPIIGTENTPSDPENPDRILFYRDSKT
ncbi:MAG: hypothetical protein HYV90_04815 [Candidatus Woesebacteria bacterium]|nr:MAG: hypothetical protein HYV90_04815 [Candidatus Woesebacteria bacterium]